MKTIIGGTVLAMALGGAAFAQQEGLVNVSVDGNTVQVPVGIAAQVCDVDANVIATQFIGSDETVCEIDQETAAEAGIDDEMNGEAEEEMDGEADEEMEEEENGEATSG